MALDAEGDGFDGEGEVGPADWRMKACLRNKLTQRGKCDHEATHMPLFLLFRSNLRVLFGL